MTSSATPYSWSANGRRKKRQSNRLMKRLHTVKVWNFFTGASSNDWIEANKSRLTNEHYGMFLRAVNPRPTMTDPQTHVDLLERADEDPDEVMQKAGEAYANRQLSQTAFAQIYRKAQKAAAEETRVPGWVSEQRSSSSAPCGPRPARLKPK